MKKIYMAAALVMGSFFAANAQTPTPDPYCLAAFSNPMGFAGNSDFITDVEFGALVNLTNQAAGSYPPSPAYTFFNNLAVPNLTAGSTYPLTLKFYVGGGAGYAVWIDYNHNNTFDAGERVAGSANATDFLALTTANPTVITKQISIPTTALNGQTRMRIRIQEDDMMPPNTLAACRAVGANDGAYYGGEAEDYLINITSATATVKPVTAFTASATTATVNNTVVTFTDQSTNTPTAWIWTFTPNTVTYQNGTNAASQNPSVKFTTGGNYSVKLLATNAAGADSLTKSNYITVGTTGIDDTKTNKIACNIYPNPVSGYLNIGIPEQTKITTATITNLEGKVLQSYNQLKENKIDVSMLPKGLYFLKITLNNGAQSEFKKFSKL
jgi:PKD repeat protein